MHGQLQAPPLLQRLKLKKKLHFFEKLMCYSLFSIKWKKAHAPKLLQNTNSSSAENPLCLGANTCRTGITFKHAFAKAVVLAYVSNVFRSGQLGL